MAWSMQAGEPDWPPLEMLDFIYYSVNYFLSLAVNMYNPWNMEAESQVNVSDASLNNALIHGMWCAWCINYACLAMISLMYSPNMCERN